MDCNTTYTNKSTGDVVEGKQKVQTEPSPSSKEFNEKLMCIMHNILIELKIMNSHLGEITGDEKTIDDLD
jgi:hypothetical protein